MAFSSGVMRYFYPRPPRGRRRENIQCEAKLLAISIHALREEGDHPYSSWERGSNEFLSTPSARRATIPRPHLLCWHHDFYPRPPRGGRHLRQHVRSGIHPISIHALREEGDGFWAAQRLSTTVFLSTPSARRATQVDVEILIFRGISIHALREEGDLVVFKPCAPPFKISIHALREEGDASLHPAMMVCNLISIHALREEGDLPTSSSAQTAVYFYPRPPRGGRRRAA